MAGLEKNSFLGRWEFLFTSPFKTGSETESTTANTSAKSDEDRMKVLESVELDDLPEVSRATADTEEKGTGVTSKKKKGKKKKSSAKTVEKTVRWGTVEQICFTRSIGYDRIPNKGAYPIGLGSETERVQSTVDQLFTAQQQSLLQRAVAKGLQLKPVEVTPPPPPPPSEHSPSPQVTATKGRKSHRRSRANSVSSLDGETVVSPVSVNMLQMLETRQFDYKGSSNPLFQPLGEDERIALLTSPAAEIVHDPHAPQANPLTEVNNEIKVLKSNRDALGCACKHTKVDKLSIAKLKSELMAHQHLIGYEGTAAEIEKMSKAELMKLVKETLKHCFLCVANDCSCVQAGIQCSAQLCGCLRGGHNPGQAQSCANPEGVDMYDPDRVKEYRRAVLAGLCGIGASTADIAN